jgi:hypothetical protein
MGGFLDRRRRRPDGGVKAPDEPGLDRLAVRALQGGHQRDHRIDLIGFIG